MDGGAEKAGRGKVLQRHKQELRAFQTEKKRLLSKAADASRVAVKQELQRREEELLAKHREEIAALDGAVDEPALESAAPPSDQRNAESATIAALESLSLYRTAKGEDGAEETTPSKGPSKSQRRKEKRAEEERRREERIREELLGSEDLGALESAAFKEALMARGLRVKNIAADGNCLFSAILDQLRLKASQGSLKEAEANAPLPEDVRSLRRAIGHFIEKEKEEFLLFLEEDQQGEEAFASLCEKIRESDEWGGELELRAAASVLKTPIEVFSVSGVLNVITYGEEFAEKTPLRLSFHRNLMALGAHYNSIVEDPAAMRTLAENLH